MKDKLNILIYTLGILLFPIFAEAKGGGKYSDLLTMLFNNIVFVAAGLVLILVFMSMWNMWTTMMDYQKQKYLKEQGIEISASSGSQETSFFQKLYDKAWSLVPMEKESTIEMDHDYDGIKELDNSLPPWWVYLFYLTIIWAIVYVYLYMFSGIGATQLEQYEADMKIAQDQRIETLFKQANAINEENVVAAFDEESMAAGKKIFIASCASCHGQLGEGGIGPNMTDKYWIHGGSINDLFKTIKYGVPEKGMISWKSQMQPSSMQKVASYILSLQGTNPPNAKKAEGDFYEGGIVENQESTEIK